MVVGLAGCGSSSSPSTPGTTAVQTANISGQVQSAASHSNFEDETDAHAANSCTSASCSTLVVGSGGSAGPACSVDSSGNFSINSVPVGQQLEAIFACGASGTEGCLVMSGDNGVSCDPVADAVIKAFLNVMGITSLADASLAKANIAQIAHSISQAAKTGTSAANTFLTAVSTCSTTACYLAAIKASPFYGPFRLMRTMVNGWDVESIYTLLADVDGFQIQVDPLTYTSFGTNLDTWLGTDFVAKTRQFVAAMAADQAAGGNTYVTQIVCQLQYSKFMGGGTIYYAPSLVTAGGVSNVPTCAEAGPSASSPLVLNGLSNGQINTINTAIANNTNGQINIGSAPDCTSYANPGFFCINQPQLFITSRASEPNRNDPLGTNNNNFIQATQVSMVNAFSPVLTALSAATIPTDTTAGPNSGSPCWSIPSNGPPVVINDAFCTAAFGTLFTPAVKNGFAGVLGLYSALKNNSLGSNNLLSLKDLYAMFGNPNFLGMKLTNQSNFSFGVMYNQNGGGTNYLQAVLNDPTVDSSNVGPFTLDPMFINSNNSTISYSSAASLYSGANFGFNDSFQLFTTIPTASTIHDYIFKTSYHVNYNPTGNSTYYAAGGKVTPPSNTGGATTDPIFCKMSNANGPLEADIGSTPGVTVTCNDAANLQVGVDVNGKITTPSNFAYPYTLSQWGYQGDSAGSLFQLVNWKTGFPIMPNGKQQFVYQKSAGNPNAICSGAGSDTNSIISTNLTMGNGASLVSQLVTAYCLDMSAFSTTNQLGFYQAGNAQISQNNPNCPSCTMGVGIVGGLNTNNANTFATPQVCVFAPSTALTIASNIATSGSGGVVINGSGQITNVGNLIIDYCSVTHASTTSYGLVTVNGWGATSPSTLYAQLLPSGSGSAPLLWQAFPTGGGSFNPTSYFLSVNAAVLNTAFEGTYSKADNSYRVSPISAPTQIQGISLANAAWQTKYDPFCDSIENDGKCHCLDGTTGMAKSGNDCTLEDSIVDPTLSTPPYFVNQGQTPTTAPAFFTDYGGKAGAQLVDTNGVGLNGSSTVWTGSGGATVFNLMINFQQVLGCQYLKTGETAYRHPAYTSNRWNHNQGGCPDATGNIAAFTCNDDCGPGPYNTAATGGGPIRVVNAVPMNNAYATLKPNAAVKVINFATKDTGQGITLDPAKKVFTFDTALALLAFRTQFPLAGISVTVGGTAIPGALGAFERINNPALAQNSNNSQLDPVSSVLCYLTNGGNSCTTSHAFSGGPKAESRDPAFRRFLASHHP